MSKKFYQNEKKKNFSQKIPQFVFLDRNTYFNDLWDFDVHYEFLAERKS